jgi:hypothetical protein
MDVELLVIPECPGIGEATKLLRAALDDIGLAETAFAVGIIDTGEAARSRGFGGSPAFIVDGTDLFRSQETTSGSPGLPGLYDAWRSTQRSGAARPSPSLEGTSLTAPAGRTEVDSCPLAGVIAMRL